MVFIHVVVVWCPLHTTAYLLSTPRGMYGAIEAPQLHGMVRISEAGVLLFLIYGVISIFSSNPLVLGWIPLSIAVPSTYQLCWCWWGGEKDISESASAIKWVRGVRGVA